MHSGFGVMMPRLHSFIDCNRCTIWWGMLMTGGSCMGGGWGGHRKSLSSPSILL